MERGSGQTPVSDERLALRAAGGCVESYETLVRRFQVPLLRFLRARTDADCEDLVQDTFVRAYRNLHRYRDTWRFSTWLFTIARRLCINAKRKNRPLADSPSLDSFQAATPDPGELAADSESRGRLWRLAADALTERQYTGLWLYYVDDLSVREIAQVLGRSESAVKTMMFRARKCLAPLLEEQEDQDVDTRPDSDGRASNQRRSTPQAESVHG